MKLLRLPILSCGLVCALFVLMLASVVSSPACTIFVLVDEERALFCNNEDWRNPNVRIWFKPASRECLGCAYVGFDDGWGQGGVNTAGLAYDWVAGFKEKWERAGQKTVEGNPAERMLEQCRTVDEAIAFFEQHWEPGFSYGRILVADRSGASAVIRAVEGKLIVRRAHDCRGFGYNGPMVTDMLKMSREPTLNNAAIILKAARQEGQFATKYANVFDLKTGDIHLFCPPSSETPVTLHLATELKKGAHYYELTGLPQQLNEPLRALYWVKPWWVFWK